MREKDWCVRCCMAVYMFTERFFKQKCNILTCKQQAGRVEGKNDITVAQFLNKKEKTYEQIAAMKFSFSSSLKLWV